MGSPEKCQLSKINRFNYYKKQLQTFPGIINRRDRNGQESPQVQPK